MQLTFDLGPRTQGSHKEADQHQPTSLCDICAFIEACWPQCTANDSGVQDNAYPAPLHLYADALRCMTQDHTEAALLLYCIQMSVTCPIQVGPLPCSSLYTLEHALPARVGPVTRPKQHHYSCMRSLEATCPIHDYKRRLPCLSACGPGIGCPCSMPKYIHHSCIWQAGQQFTHGWVPLLHEYTMRVCIILKHALLGLTNLMVGHAAQVPPHFTFRLVAFICQSRQAGMIARQG